MKAFFRSSINFKITILIWFGSLLVLAMILSYSYVQVHKLILSEADKSARGITLSAARKIEQEFRAIEKIANQMAIYLGTARLDKQGLLTLLRQVVLDNPEIYGATVAFQPNAFEEGLKFFAPYYYKASDGVKLEYLGSDDYNYFQKDWYHVPEVLGRPVWCEPYFDESGGRIIMTTYAVPVFAPSTPVTSGRKGSADLLCIVTADIALEWLSQMVCSIPVGQTGYCFIISDTGTFVTHGRPELIMRESIFSVAEDRNNSLLREVGRAMTRQDSGFVDVGTFLGGEEAFLAYAPIPSPGWTLAVVFPKAELFYEVVKLHQTALGLALAGATLLLAASVIVARSIARPLSSMADATKKIAAGDLDIDLSHIRTTDEVGQLARALTRMAEGLKERDFIRDTFGRYLTREVVKRLLESEDGLRLGGETREISIIMSDLRGFTALTSSMHPEQVITFLNRYLGKMIDILIEYRGTVDEIIGDGILAFFGAPEPLEDHPARAVACALRMQLAMDEINSLNEADGFPRLEMGVAVNTGKVVVGNIGSEKRSKYGAVGSQVNFTGRVESFTVGGQVLVSKSTHDRLVDMLEISNILCVQMKGVPGTVDLYDIVGIKGDYDTHLPRKKDTRDKLKNKLRVQVQSIDQKTVKDSESIAWITDVSATSAIMIAGYGIRQWDDLRLRFFDDEYRVTGGDFFAKAVSVTKTHENYEVLMRFTSISPEVYKIIRQVTASE